MGQATDATITLSYMEAGLLMAALDHALCHQGKPSKVELRELRPIVDKMASTFGFPTDRLDRLLKGQKVEAYPAAFTTQRSADAFRRRIDGMINAKRRQEDSDG